MCTIGGVGFMHPREKTGSSKCSGGWRSLWGQRQRDVCARWTDQLNWRKWDRLLQSSPSDPRLHLVKNTECNCDSGLSRPPAYYLLSERHWRAFTFLIELQMIDIQTICHYWHPTAQLYLQQSCLRLAHTFMEPSANYCLCVRVSIVQASLGSQPMSGHW